MSEFIDDVKQRIILQCKELGISAKTAGMLAAEITGGIGKDYAGERVYIGKTEDAQAETSNRNRAIIRDYKAGERVPLLARRYGISRVHVWRIIAG